MGIRIEYDNTKLYIQYILVLTRHTAAQAE